MELKFSKAQTNRAIRSGEELARRVIIRQEVNPLNTDRVQRLGVALADKALRRIKGRQSGSHRQFQPIISIQESRG